MVLAGGKVNGSAAAARRFGSRASTVYRKKSTNPVDNGCPKGMELYKTSVAATPTTCQVGEVTSCPPGFACFKSSIDGTHQCCGRRDTCPENSAAFINPLSHAPVNCGAMAGCPEAFFCYMPSAGEHGACCSLDVVSGLCGQGTSLLNERGRAVACDKVPCPVGFNCVMRFNVSFCCPNEAAPPQSAYHYSRGSGKCEKFVYSGCSGNDNRFQSEDACERFCKNAVLCPRESPLVDPDGRMTTCSATASCMPRYQCHITDRRSFCCRKPDLSEACPRGQRPFMDVVDMTPMICDGDAVTAQCPNGYKCEWNRIYKHGYCCMSASSLATLLKRTEENF
ncbi:kunitz/Bovine pancreatic trypsin inhibitor domain protein, partial [Aphelenchoides avenae]